MKKLLKILLGPGLRNTSYTIKVNYLVLILLREMIKFSMNAKKTIYADDQSLEAIIRMVEPAHLRDTAERLEICIYQFLS